MLKPLPAEPFISAYGTTYNHEDYVAEAIESVLAQGWPADRFEYVLVDDGSTDATQERVKPYLKHITYIRQDNQGINATVSRAIAQTRGDVMVPCSGDDMWPPDRLERTVSQLHERPDAGFIYGDMEVIDGRSKVISSSFMRGNQLVPHEGQIAGKLLAGNFVSGGSIAVRGELKSVILPIPAEAAWEDWWFAWALTNVAPAGYVDAPVYRYRMHGANFVFGLTDAETYLDRISEEVRFRRYMLGAVRPGTSSLADLLEGVDSLRRVLLQLTGGGRAIDTLLALTDAQRSASERLAADAAAIAERSPLLAAFTAARAVATDPTSASAYGALHAVAGRPAAPASRPFDDVRAVIVFADAEELVADPSLLAAYVSAFEPADDVTLVAVARTWNAARLGSELAPIAERVAGQDPPDILALPASPAAWLSGLTHADCVLGLPDLPVPGLARFAAAESLRAYVAQRWRFPSAHA
jgi:glycosyltransferase involved in cell wall biosynthesis